jgi:hypothetical protein
MKKAKAPPIKQPYQTMPERSSNMPQSPTKAE